MVSFCYKIIYWVIGLSFLVILFALLSIPSGNLKIITCDVGQGDAILIELGFNQILIDGGPDEKVLGCLHKHIPFWDRTIELVVMSHPQKDHYMGLVQVMKTYKVVSFLTSGLGSSSPDFQLLESIVGGSDTKVLYTSDLSMIGLGLMHLEILNPDRNYILSNYKTVYKSKPNVLSQFNSDLDPNKFSVVLLLTYKNVSALFTGDLDPDGNDRLASQLAGKPSIDYLKVPHHGSKKGLTQSLFDRVNPAWAAISVGRNNKYGHPSRQILDMIGRHGVQVLRTDQKGTIELQSDGFSPFFQK